MAHIKGLDSWMKFVESIPKEFEQEVKEVIAKTAYKIEADAKMLCPVDTGHLRGSIGAQFDIKTKGYLATIGTNVEYALHVEFGTSKQPAKPFLIPAYLKWKPKFENQLREILKRVGD